MPSREMRLATRQPLGQSMNLLDRSDRQSSEDTRAWIVRRACVADLGRVLAIEQESATAAHWGQQDYAAFCRPDAEEGKVVAKALFVAHKIHSQQILGFAAFQVILAAGECGLENMGVDENWRRRGVGGRLLAAGLLWCRGWRAMPENVSGQDDCLWLEVRASNGVAIAFYRQAGFVEVGRRIAYYSQPEEDALQMSKTLRPHV